MQQPLRSTYYENPYGDISNDIIMSKFEETNYPTDTNEYNDYARMQASDFRPDTIAMASGEARGGVNASAGMLQLRHEGHRGNGNWERPEMFLGFGGPEDHDPRGVATGPDLKLLREQENFRNKYVRFSAENDQQITGLGRSESKSISDNQTVFKWKKDNLKIFDRQLDGRQEGLKRSYEHTSVIPKVADTADYGEKITSDMRQVNRAPKYIFRESRNEGAWRTETWDQDYDIIRYANTRKAGAPQNEKKARTARGSNDTYFNGSATQNPLAAAKVAMKNLVLIKQQSNDLLFAQSDQTRVLKSKAKTDLSVILGAIKHDTYLQSSHVTKTYRTPSALDEKSKITYVNADHEVEEINKEIILKSVKPNADRAAIRKEIIADPSTFSASDATVVQKSALRKITTGAKVDTKRDMELTEHLQTVNYKLAQSKTKRLPTEVCPMADADLSQIRRDKKVGRFVYRDVEMGQTFLDNTQKDRLAARVGSKYTARYHDRDAIQGELAAMS